MVKLRIIIAIAILFCTILLLISCPGIEGEDVFIFNNSDESIIWIYEDIEYEFNPWITNSAGKVISSMEDNKNSIWYIRPGGRSLAFISSDRFNGAVGNTPYIISILSYDSVLMIPWDRVRDERISLNG
jgi:hypothetical protein